MDANDVRAVVREELRALAGWLKARWMPKAMTMRPHDLAHEILRVADRADTSDEPIASSLDWSTPSAPPAPPAGGDPGVDELIIRLRAEVEKGWRDIPQVLHKDHIMSHAADTLAHFRTALAAANAAFDAECSEHDETRRERDEARAESEGLRADRDAALALRSAAQAVYRHYAGGGTYDSAEDFAQQGTEHLGRLREALLTTPAPAADGKGEK